jgi:IMP dehydrogenase/GMP reductase
MSVFDFEHINLIPQKCIVESRSECETSVVFERYPKVWNFNLPVVPANMQCVIDKELAEKLASNDYFYIYHRFGGSGGSGESVNEDIINFIRTMKEKNLFTSISIGVNDDSYDLMNILRKEELIPDFITIDIAHGHSIKMEAMVTWLRGNPEFEYTFIIAGNVSTAKAVEDLESWGVDAIKCGIAPGCFVGDTRVLMANGIYKDIKDIIPGEFVINKDGISVKVLNVMNQGYKNVTRLKNNLSYKDTFVTKDHKFFIGDLSTSSPKSISSAGIAKLLDKQSKTIPKISKYKWKEVGECDWDNTFALFPKNINWNLPENFTIDLNETLNRGKCEEETITTVGGSEPVTFKRYLNSSYDLGYIFGTFLGNGSSKMEINKINNTECGSVNWSFDTYKEDICKKLCKSIKNVLDIDVDYKSVKDKNVNIIYLYNKCFTKMIYEFGKKTNKHLPEKYFCKNKEYIQGLFDGLMDSDGHIDFDEDKQINKIYNFTNTSIHLIELYQWCCFNLGISFTSKEHNSENPQGGLKNLSETPIFNKAFRVKTHTMNRFTKDYLYSNILNYDSETKLEETWDIEVDCPTHSFIANNMIVHNSACTTYMNTGFGSRGIQAYMIEECTKAKIYPRTKIIADGGIIEPGDIAKSIVLGADMVMIGGMFSGLIDSPGPTITAPDGKLYKEFWGSASAHQSGKTNRIEGTKKLIPLQTRDMLGEMNFIKECLQSSISYGGGKMLQALRKVRYIIKK